MPFVHLYEELHVLTMRLLAVLAMLQTIPPSVFPKAMVMWLTSCRVQWGQLPMCAG